VNSPGQQLLYRLYRHRLRRQIAGGRLPRHAGIVMDGNRRWARAAGLDSASLGHRRGAEHLDDVLGWCDQVDIDYVTVFVCSVENPARRDPDEIALLMELIEEFAQQMLDEPRPRWRLHVAGVVDVLPDATARALKAAVEATASCPSDKHLTLAIGYGGRREVLDAVRDLLLDKAAAGASVQQIAGELSVDDIASRLYTAGLPEPDLVIRTSEEQRLSNFLLWQSAYSEMLVSETLWPDFGVEELKAAIADYSSRVRRFGGRPESEIFEAAR